MVKGKTTEIYFDVFIRFNNNNYNCNDVSFS